MFDHVSIRTEKTDLGRNIKDLGVGSQFSIYSDNVNITAINEMQIYYVSGHDPSSCFYIKHRPVFK
jgi:hypothetical protein